MRRGRNSIAFEFAEIVDVENRSTWAGREDFERLIEVAIVERAVVSDADEATAHQTLCVVRVEMIDEESHVGFVPAIAMKLVGEAFDRHVGDREQAIEDDPESTPEFIAILGLERFLGRREEGADGVVDQVESQLRFGSAIAERIQSLKGADAAVEDAAPTLLFDILGAVAGQGSDEVDTLIGQKNVPQTGQFCFL